MISGVTGSEMNPEDPTSPSPAESNLEKSRVVALSWVFGLCGGLLVIFAINLFLLEGWMRTAIGPLAAQYVYIAIRVLGLGALAHGLTRYAFRNRFQVISTVLLVGFIDQVFIKGLRIKQDILANPGNWTGFEPTNAAIFVNMATGYLFFIPVVLIVSFLGMFSTHFMREWRA